MKKKYVKDETGADAFDPAGRIAAGDGSIQHEESAQENDPV
jgi:hypothetical protein